MVGSAEEQTLRIPVFRDRPNNEAVSEEGVTVLLPKQLQLNDFTVEQYPNGTPRHFFAEISIDGKPASLEVNHPYAASWGEQYYLTSYDMQSEQPQYCVVQIVREPLKYLMLAGIIMMLCGACCSSSPARMCKRTSLLKHRARAKRIINVCRYDLHMA